MTDEQETNHAVARSRSNAGLGLPPASERENVVNMLDNLLNIYKGASARCALLYRVALYIAVCLPVFSEAAPVPEWQNASKCISINCAEASVQGGRSLSFLQEVGADRHSDVVELLPPVSPKGEPVSKNDTKAKGNDSDNYALLHWMFPVVMFFIGFLIGYEPAGRGKSKSPNVQVHQPAAHLAAGLVQRRAVGGV